MFQDRLNSDVYACQMMLKHKAHPLFSFKLLEHNHQSVFVISGLNIMFQVINAIIQK